MQAAMQAEGSKRLFFPKLRDLAPMTLTANPFIASNIKLKSTAKNALFIGDSIMGEVSKSYARLVGADAMSFAGVKDTGRNASGVAAYQGRVEAAYAERPFHVAFVGGLGLHHLLRATRSVGGAGHVALPHKDVVAQYLAMFRAFSVGLGVPVVFVGMPTVDAATVLMAAAKHDFGDFYDLAVPVLWDAVEARAVQLEHAKVGGGAAGLFHLRLAELTNACPGVRCDGMHFASFGRECEPSSALWDHFLGEFLLRCFGGPIAG
jgi:hypothetical protein